MKTKNKIPHLILAGLFGTADSFPGSGYIYPHLLFQ